MLTTLQTSYTDTRAGDLAWCLGKEPLPALAVLDLELGVPQGQTTTTGTIRVQLRLLGASHQVLLDAPGGRFCSETVACMPGASTPLPFGVAERIGEWEYEFAARVETLSRGQFAGRALATIGRHGFDQGPVGREQIDVLERGRLIENVPGAALELCHRSHYPLSSTRRAESHGV